MRTANIFGVISAPLVLAGVALCHCGSDNAGAIPDADGGDDALAEGAGGGGAEGGFGKSDGAISGLACTSIGTACATASDCCVNVCGNGFCGGAAQADGAPGPKACNGDGKQCAKGFDCCSGTCTNSACVGNVLGAADGGASGGGASGPLSCGAPQATCKVAGDCCSGVCEPVTGQAGVIECRDACKADGQPCVTAQDCCSLGCFNNVCSAMICVKIGDTCKSDQECCSGVCNSKGECDVDLANSTCRPTGEDCSSGPQSGCCGATKDNDLCVNGRCGRPPNACEGLGATCASDTDCCNKHCDPGTKTCTLPVACVPTGGACATGADCCASSCTNGSCDAPAPLPGGGAGGGGGTGGTLPDGAPAPGPTLCDPVGATCTTGATCCSGLCLAGICDIPPR
jgi:hypothetical protein